MSKFYCRFCHIYIDDNRAQRTQHELGSRHREAVERSIASSRAEKQKQQHAERDLEAQLQAIDAAARESLKETSDEAELSLPESCTLSRKRKSPEDREWKGEHDIGNLNDREIYTIDGRSYMAGDEFKDKLVPGTFCEVFIEEDDKGWLPASISIRHDQDIPNSDAKITTFDVTYFQVDDAGASTPGFATGIKPDCLRLECHNDGPELNMEDVVVEETQEVEESTGLGKWETVVVHEEVDEFQPRLPKQSKHGTHEGVSLKSTNTVLNEELGGGDKLVGFKRKKKKPRLSN